MLNALLFFVGSVCCAEQVDVGQLSKVREETPFVFHFEDKDAGVVDEVLIPMQDVLKRMVKKYQCTIPETIEVKIFPALQTLHDYFGQPEAPEWLIGGKLKTNEIAFVSPNEQNSYHSRGRILFVPVHSLIQLQLDNKYPTVPAWLNWGISQYESGVFASPQMKKKVRNHLRQKIEKGEIPTLSDLQSDESIFRIQAHTFPHTMVLFVQQRWGQDVLRSLLENEGNIEKVLGTSNESFYNEWLAFLKERFYN